MTSSYETLFIWNSDARLPFWTAEVKHCLWLLSRRDDFFKFDHPPIPTHKPIVPYNSCEPGSMKANTCFTETYETSQPHLFKLLLMPCHSLAICPLPHTWDHRCLRSTSVAVMRKGINLPSHPEAPEPQMAVMSSGFELAAFLPKGMSCVFFIYFKWMI